MDKGYKLHRHKVPVDPNLVFEEACRSAFILSYLACKLANNDRGPASPATISRWRDEAAYSFSVINSMSI